MGTLTHAELREEVLVSLGNRNDVTPSRLTRALNLAQERLARRHDFEELQVTTSTTLTYTGVAATDLYLPMPDSAPYIREIYSVLLKDGVQSRKLRRVFTRTWDRLLTDPTALNEKDHPVFYTIWDYKLAKAEIYPLPNKSYDIQWRLSKWPTPLTTDSQTSDYRFKDELLIELGVIYIMDSLGKEADADRHRKKFAELYLEGLNTDSDKPDLDIEIGAGIPNNMSLGGDYWRDPFIRSLTDGDM
ncbi:MAG: hypothetical protein E6Q97_11905 [Desulfurellales bacterium]|nr:MAG: hypothetical protein E6Q97_11905 [Desulfurellales bacterium]